MKPSILIVEDEMIVAEDLARTLSELGYRIAATTHTGEDAVEIATRECPDIVLMDIILGKGMSGIEASRRLMPLDIPVVFLTAFADESTKAKASMTKPYGYVVKPFTERELHANIEMALFEHGMSSKLRESEERFRKVVMTSPDAMFILDTSTGKPLLLNRDEFAGKASSSITNLTDLLALMVKEDRPHIERFVSATGLQEGASDEFRIPHGDRIRWYRMRVAVLSKDRRGEPLQVLLSVTDITLVKEAQESLVQRRMMQYRYSMMKNIADLLPVFLSQEPGSISKDDLIRETMVRLERTFYPLYFEGTEGDLEAFARGFVTFMTDMGGAFSASVEEGRITFVGDKCLWGNGTDRNPLMCLLTRKLVERIASKAVAAKSSVFDTSDPLKCRLIVETAPIGIAGDNKP